MDIRLNALSSYAPFFCKEKSVTPIKRLQKAILVIAVIALACLAAFCLVRRKTASDQLKTKFKQTQNNNPADDAKQGKANDDLHVSEPMNQARDDKQIPLKERDVDPPQENQPPKVLEQREIREQATPEEVAIQALDDKPPAASDLTIKIIEAKPKQEIKQEQKNEDLPLAEHVKQAPDDKQALPKDNFPLEPRDVKPAQDDKQIGAGYGLKAPRVHDKPQELRINGAPLFPPLRKDDFFPKPPPLTELQKKVSAIGAASVAPVATAFAAPRICQALLLHVLLQLAQGQNNKPAFDDQAGKQTPAKDDVHLDAAAIKQAKQGDANPNPDQRLNPTWINDHPDVPLEDLGLTDLRLIRDFLKKNGKELRCLHLNHKLADWEFEMLIKLCPNLKQLSIHSNKLTDRVLEQLKVMPVTDVNFSRCSSLTDEALCHLSGMPLTHINFSFCDKLTDKAIEQLKDMPLTSVTFIGCTKLTNKALEHLKGLSLTSVNFCFVKQLTDDALEHLKGMPLTSVNFCLCEHLTDKAVEHLKGMSLKTVNFSGCKKLSADVLEHFKGMPLTSIDFSGCENLTNKSLESLKGMTLAKAYFTGCNKVTDEAVKRLKDASDKI